MKKLILYWFTKQTANAARKELAHHFDANTIKDILSGYWKQYQKLKTTVPSMPTNGGYITVRLAAMSMAFYRELMARGQDKDTATRHFYTIAWNVYKKMGKLAWWLAGWRNRNKVDRMATATRLFRTFPFNSPSYQWQDIPGDDAVAFNCIKCPVAEYFKSHGLSEFCAATWCALDFPLAALWHARLERTGSIAGGADKCDFRWIHDNEKKNV